MPSTRRAVVFVSIALFLAAAACVSVWLGTSRGQWQQRRLVNGGMVGQSFTPPSGYWMNDTGYKSPTERAPDESAA